MNRANLSKVLTRELSFNDAARSGLVKFSGNPAKFAELMSYMVDMNQFFWYNIVPP